MTKEETKKIERPARAFLHLARRLMAAYNEQISSPDRTAEQAMKRASFFIKLEEKLDYSFKGGMLAVGGGILMGSGWGPLAIFTGLAMATTGGLVVRNGTHRNYLIDEAARLYTQLGETHFSQFLRTGERQLGL